MKRTLILLSFLMAINLVFTTYYGLIVKDADDLLENSSIQEILENHAENKCDFLITSFWFTASLIPVEMIIYIPDNSQNFSSFEQDIHLPPPDFSWFSS